MKTVEPMVTKFGTLRCGSVAEWLGNRTWDQQVAGSNPGRRAADCDSRQCATVTKQYNLVPANGRWCSAAGEVTVGLVESNGSLPPGLWHRSPAGWLPRTAVSSGTLRSFPVRNYLYLWWPWGTIVWDWFLVQKSKSRKIIRLESDWKSPPFIDIH